MPEKTTITDKRIFYKLNISQRILLKYVDREVTDKLGVPVIQTAALFHLLKHDGCRLKDLSNVLFQNKSATTPLAERMEKKRSHCEKKIGVRRPGIAHFFNGQRAWKMGAM